MSPDPQELIANHLQLAKDIARKEWLTATHALNKDDMLGLAYLGLVDAANRWESYCKKNDYDPEAVQFFRVFASLRIRGTIRDDIRREDWATRTLRSKSKKLKDAGQDDGIPIQDLAEITGMSVNEIHKVNARLAVKPVSLEAKLMSSDYANGVGPSEKALKEDVDTEGTAFANEMTNAFVETLKILPLDVVLVIVLHYYSNLDFRSIAQDLQLSEIRVSQLHSTGVQAVRDALLDAAMERE